MNLSSSKFNIIIKKNLKKYNKSIKKSYIWKINNLVFHKKCHFTSIFIEYLILDDIQEFLFEEYPLIYSYINIPFFSKYLIPKIIFSFILDECGRNLILKNIKKKKALLYTYLIEAKRKIFENPNHIYNKYSNIMPKNISEISLVSEKKIISNDEQTKEISETESTIDNVNANNDISISIDLKINQKYDIQILNQNIDFIKNKRGKNDEEIIKMINNLSINNRDINKNEKLNDNKLIYLDYINNKRNISKNKNNNSDEYQKINIKEILECNNRKIVINSKSKERKKINRRNIENKITNNNKLIPSNNNYINNITTISTNINSYNNTSFRSSSRENDNKFLKKSNKQFEEIISVESYEKVLATSEKENKIPIFNSKENIKKELFEPKISINNTKIINLNKSKEKYDNIKKKNIINNMKKNKKNKNCLEYSPQNKKTKTILIYKNSNNNNIGKKLGINNTSKKKKSLEKKIQNNKKPIFI